MRLGAHCSLAVCPKTEAVSWEKKYYSVGPHYKESKAKLVALCCVCMQHARVCVCLLACLAITESQLYFPVFPTTLFLLIYTTVNKVEKIKPSQMKIIDLILSECQYIIAFLHPSEAVGSAFFPHVSQFRLQTHLVKL